MSVLTGVTNYLPTVNEGFTTTVNGDIASNATTVPLNSVTGLTDGTVFVGIVEPGDATKQQVFTGTVDVANSRIINAVYTRGTSASGHLNGSTIVDYVTGTAFNMLSKHLQQQHNQNGTHGVVTATSLTTSGGLTVTGGSVVVPANSLQALALATNAINLGYAEITSTFNTATAGSDVDVTGLSVTVTVPTGGRKVRVEAVCSSLFKSGSAGDVVIWKLKEGSTQLNESSWNIAGSNYAIGGAACLWEGTPSAGSHTYKVAVFQATAGAVQVTGASNKLSFISVKVI